MVCEIAHFVYSGATGGTLIHRQLSRPMRKPSPIHSCTYDQKYETFTSSRLLSHFYRGDTDLSASIDMVWFIVSFW